MSQKLKSQTSDRLLAWPQVAAMIPYTRQHVGRLELAGKFPERLQLGPCRVVWRESEILAWIDALPRGALAQSPNASRRGRKAA